MEIILNLVFSMFSVSFSLRLIQFKVRDVPGLQILQTNSCIHIYTTLPAAQNRQWRLHFNQVGYQIYGKEQSRRVCTFPPSSFPSDLEMQVPRRAARPGNPGELSGAEVLPKCLL